VTELHKYPRTPHLEGSRLQPGDHDLDQVPLESLRGAYVVVEEKIDGANAGMSLDDAGRLRLQSRGHFLTGGPRERHFDLYKQWAHAHQVRLAERLGGGLTLYGEWLYAKHTVFYDQLPHYFMEFDILDHTGAFWSTQRRTAHLAGSRVVSVPVLFEGLLDKPQQLPSLVARSLYKSVRWNERLRACAEEAGVEPDRAVAETDSSELAEGLYIKVEDPHAGIVLARYKWIRASFLTAVVDSGSHWHSRPIIANQLADGVDLWR
jgi:hypothetical protein